MKPLLAFVAFAARHFLFVAVATAIFCIGWTILYVALLIVAAVSGAGLGGPLAYPAGIVFILFCGALFGWGIFAPACGLARLLCHGFRLPRIAGIPLSLALALAISFLPMQVMVDPVFGANPLPWFIHLAVIALPLSVQWWFTEGPAAIAQILGKLWQTRMARVPSR
jgi:hypothetical protein